MPSRIVTVAAFALDAGESAATIEKSLPPASTGIKPTDDGYFSSHVAYISHPRATARLIEEAEDAELQLQVGVNLLGAVYCMRSAIAAMRRRGGGDIINVSSESVQTPYPFLSFYAATK